MGRKNRKLLANISRHEKRLLCYEYIKQGHPINKAEKLAGLYRGAARRTSALLLATGDVHDRPRSGRPRTYNAELLDSATQVFLEQDDVVYTAKSFTAMLEQRGILHRPYKTATFMNRWKEHLKSQGHSLRTRYTRTVFLICKEDRPKRLAFAAEMLRLLREHGIQAFVFVDETTKEQSPHPKAGQRCFSAHATMPHATMHAHTVP